MASATFSVLRTDFYLDGNFASLIDVYNDPTAVDTDCTLQIFRVHCAGRDTTALNGTHMYLCVSRVQNPQWAGTALTPVKYDTDAATINAHVNAAYGRAFDTRIVLREQYITTEEPSVTGLKDSEHSLAIPHGVVWRWGLKTTKIKPLTLGEGYGMAVETKTPNQNLGVKFTGLSIDFKVVW